MVTAAKSVNRATLLEKVSRGVQESRARLPQPVAVGTRAATGGRQVGVRNCGKLGRRQSCQLCPHLGAAADSKTVVRQVNILHSGEVFSINEDMDCTTEITKRIKRLIKL